MIKDWEQAKCINNKWPPIKAIPIKLHINIHILNHQIAKLIDWKIKNFNNNKSLRYQRL